MQNFDVENNFLLVNKALLLVLKMCFGFATTGRNVVLCNVLCSIWIKPWRNLPMR